MTCYFPEFRASYSFNLLLGAVAAVGPIPATAVRNRKTNRALGISAEPQSLKSLQDLTTKTFPEYEKDTR